MMFSFVACGNGNGGGNPYFGTKAPTATKEVGDIVFSDGSATPYTANLTLTDSQRNAAIALIFYKGTELNSGNDTTARTLGVGLKHGYFIWCSSAANAYNVNITTIQCPASESSGGYTFSCDKNGSDNLEQIEAFSGVDDTATVSKYPAFYFGKNYKNQTGSHAAGTSYETGWYLPSIAELFQIYANGKGENKVFDVDAASTLCGGDIFGSSYYWSSTQYALYSNIAAYRFNFSNVACSSYGKDGISYVCAIREF